jgi:hypothetical protein
MPNHVGTIVKYDKKHHEEVAKKVASLPSIPEDEKREFDFKSLIPMPSHIFTGDLGRKDEEKHGEENCWLKWCRFNWGTKWNAYDILVKPGEIKFDTAWNHPIPVLRQLSCDFPEIEFEVLYADENWGYNLGHYRIKNLEGGMVKEYVPGTPEAIKFACEVHGEDYNEYYEPDGTPKEE